MSVVVNISETVGGNEMGRFPTLERVVQHDDGCLWHASTQILPVFPWALDWTHMGFIWAPYGTMGPVCVFLEPCSHADREHLIHPTMP